MSFIARQPNGLLCRFSSILDNITNFNMTEEEYIELCKREAEEMARKTIESYCEPFSSVSREFFRFGPSYTHLETEAIFEAMGESPEDAAERRKYWRDIGVYDVWENEQ